MKHKHFWQPFNYDHAFLDAPFPVKGLLMLVCAQCLKIKYIHPEDSEIEE